MKDGITNFYRKTLIKRNLKYTTFTGITVKIRTRSSEGIIKIVNFTKEAKRLTNVFKKNCGELDSGDDTLLFYTKVSWLYELNKEMKIFFG